MLNNQGHDRGHDQGNNRNFSSQYNSPQGQGAFPLGGNLQGLHHNLPGGYNLQNRGLGGLAQAGNQVQQNRYGNQNLPSSMQYAQVGNRAGMSVLNGLNGPPNVPRGQGNSPGLQGNRGQAGGLGALGGLGGNIQRQPTQNLAGLQRGIGNLGLGTAGSNHLGLQQMGSPARSNAMGLGYQTINQQGLGNPNQPSGELLAMMNKGTVGGQLGGLGGMGQSFDRQQQQHHQQAPSNQNSVAASPIQNQDKEQPAFHDSEFPALGGVLRSANVGIPNGDRPGSLDGSNIYAHIGVHKGLLPSEFNIQSEEFPALPGATGREADGRQSDQQSTNAANQVGQLKLRQGTDGQYPGQSLATAGAGQTGSQAGATQEQLLRFYQMHGRYPTGKVGPSGALQNPVGKQQSGNQTSTAQPDRFGLLGLLSVIRMTDPDLTTLALGTDLTTLGLHLNSSDNVYKTFAHPWADNPLRPEPDFSVPACYKQTPPRLKPGYFSKFQQDTLFYIFHSMPADEAQIFAADELASRGWGFNKELKAWMTRAPNTEPSLKTQQMEQGTYLLFDTSIWETVKKDMVLTYTDIETAPRLPRPGAQNQPPQPPQK